MHPYIACFSFALLLLLSLTAGGVAGRSLKKGPLLPRLALYLLGPAAVTVLHLFYYESVWAIFKEQNWARLDRTIALFMGFPLYPVPDTGPAMTTIYGPVSALAYWPAVLADTPSFAVQIGLAVSILFFFLPALAVVLRKNQNENTLWIPSLLTFICFVLVASLITSTKESAYTIHADAPALGLGLFACFFIYLLNPGEARWKPLAASALFATLSVSAKQSALPLLAALPLYLLFVSGPKAFWRYILCLAAAGCGALFLLEIFFGLKSAFYYVLYLPSQHPMKEGGAGMVLKALWRFVRESLIIAGATVPVLWCALRPAERKRGFRKWVENYPWVLFFWVGFCMLPVALVSNMKIGGSNNTVSFVTYYLLMGTMAGLIHAARRHENKSVSKSRTVVHATILLYTAIVVVIIAPRIFYKIIKYDGRADFGGEAYAYTLLHPGTVYFPRITLVHLMAEKKMYHAADGLMDRAWADKPVSETQFRAHAPSDLKFIGFNGEDHRSIIPLQGFAATYRHTKQLPSFIVYAREEALERELNQ